MPKRNQDVPSEYREHESAVAEAMGIRIRQRRRKLKLTQEQVRTRMEAEGVSMSAMQYSRVENGDSLLNAAEVIALAAVLEVSYKWLLEGEEPSSRGKQL